MTDPVTAQPRSGNDVLVVEDDAEINALIGEYVRLSGRDCRSALDGHTALREAENRLPGVVILDVMLPDIDGFEVCRRLKGDARTADVPVIFLTALSDEQSVRTGMSLGAADYLAKPFEPDRLLSAVSRLVRNASK